MDGLRDGVTVHGAALERVQDRQIQGALQESRLSGFPIPMTVYGTGAGAAREAEPPLRLKRHRQETPCSRNGP